MRLYSLAARETERAKETRCFDSHACLADCLVQWIIAGWFKWSANMLSSGAGVFLVGSTLLSGPPTDRKRERSQSQHGWGTMLEIRLIHCWFFQHTARRPLNGFNSKCVVKLLQTEVYLKMKFKANKSNGFLTQF